jgi:two-component sensor histidine kinase/CHASE3 domain sensor protein
MKERWPWPRATLADPGLVLAPGLVVLVLVAALSAYLILEADQTAILARSANELRLINLQLNNKIADAETGQRGYLLTSDPAYLAPYKEAVRDIPQLSRKLIDITAGNPARQALAVHAEELAQLKLGDIQKTVDLQNRGDAPAAIATVREDTGKKYFDELRGILSELSEQATADVDGRRQESMSQRRLLMGVTLAGLILSAILSVIALTRARRQIGELRERHRTLADLNEMLEHRVAERTAELQQAKLETERERDQIRALLTDVNHRIGNNLQLVSSMLGFHARFAVGEETRNTLQAARNQVQSIASAQRRLRLLAGSDEVELGSFLEGLLQDMRDTLTPDRPIKVELSASPANASSKTAVSIGVIVNELISNAVKHAFPDGQEGCVRVALTTGENGRLEEIVVEDDGVGFSLPVGTEPSGLGGKIVQALSHSLNASLSVETAAPGRERPGTRIRLILRELEPAA